MMHHVLTGKKKYLTDTWSWSIMPYPPGIEREFLEVPSILFEVDFV